jgi:hypothetical protein
VRKSAAWDSNIGVHGATLNGKAIQGVNNLEVESQYTAIEADWLRKNGAPPIVVFKALNTPSNSMYWLTPKDLADWHVTVVGEVNHERR